MKKINGSIKWGIIGLGNIAGKFAKDLKLVNGSVLEAVASRNLKKAHDFSEQYDSNSYYGTYIELIKDPEVHIIYVATPHNSHKSITLLALQHGKAVLCEKPFAMNSRQVLQMIAASKKNQMFLMEALWSRFIPVIKKVKSLIDEGTIGSIRYINADFSFLAPSNIRRIYDKELGGGSLLDIGIYPVFLAYLFLGKPKKILAHSHKFESGADEQLSMIFHYKEAQAVLHSSFKSTSSRMAKISGTKGEIIIDAAWNESDSFNIIKDGVTEHISLPTIGRGFTHEIQECNACLHNGKLESDLWSLNNSIDLMALLDQIRSIIGLVYKEDLKDY